MINHHSIEVEAAATKIFKEMLLWGESSWWPTESAMRYTRLTPGEIGVGTRYHQKVHKPFGPEWDVEVISIGPDREVSKKFLNGMFSGVEREYIIPGRGSCDVHFLMDFEVTGGLNRFLWDNFFKDRHDENISIILRALKGYIEGKPVSADVEEHPATPEEAERRRFLKGIFRR